MKRILQYLCEVLWQVLSRQHSYWTYHRLIRSGVLTVGRHTYGLPEVEVYKGSESRVIIHSFCSISPRVLFIVGGIHRKEWVSLFPFRALWKMPGAYSDGMPTTKGDIVVGCDVWLGTEAMILSGVTVGHGSVVCARSVVTRNVPPFAIVAGVPARVIGYRFDEPTRARLLQVAWWDWSDNKIRMAVSSLSSPDVEAFLTAATSGLFLNPSGLPSTAPPRVGHETNF